PIIYYTDRTPGNTTERGQEYGYERSPSAAYGTLKVHFGKGIDTWDKLVTESRKVPHSSGLTMTVSDIQELARYPQTPEPLDLTSSTTEPAILPAAVEARQQADEAFRALLSQRLAQTPKKEVFIFVHGYHCEFEWPAFTIAQLWHYWGREGVPIAYSWPAASPGLLRGYQYDRESSEYTIYHFKRFLQRVASCPDVQKINIISHSRGTDVCGSGLRELSLQMGGPLKAREALKLGVVVFAAADIDVEVASQRFAADQVLQIPERTTLYVSAEDAALGLSDWLFASSRRLGMLRPQDLRGPIVKTLQRYPNVEVVDARVNLNKAFSHSYFLAHPSGSSDMILLMRDKAHAGSPARPLERDPSGFWILKDDYLEPPQAASK
ncbi:MAG TPA: alpha/beta hydrolase, partial [Tepidisphaeraceae bacterium]